jgi:hypothetical protein
MHFECNSRKDAIPSDVTHLIFGTFFDESIEGLIPNTVTHLTFGSFFNQPLHKFIPNSVTHLTFINSRSCRNN